MSFSFNAVGSREEVIGQLGAHALASENQPASGQLAEAARDLIIDALDLAAGATTYSGHTHAYIVKASGHAGDHSVTNLTITIEPVWIRLIPAEPVTDDGAAIVDDEVPAT